MRNGFACPRMPPCAQEEFTGVKKDHKKPLITLEQLHEHTKPDDLWIGVCSLSPERTVALTPLLLFNHAAAASRILPHHVPLCVHPVDCVVIHHLGGYGCDRRSSRSKVCAADTSYVLNCGCACLPWQRLKARCMTCPNGRFHTREASICC